MKKHNPYLVELFWLLACLAISILLYFLLVRPIGIDGYDFVTFNFVGHDTYFVLDSILAFFLILVLVVFTTFLFRVFYQRFTKKVTNTILQLNIVAMIAGLGYLINSPIFKLLNQCISSIYGSLLT